MKEQTAIQFLTDLGYKVLLPSSPEIVFTCIHGHRHRTEERKQNCELKRSAEYREESAKREAERCLAAQERAIAAYMDFVSGKKKSEIAKSLGVTRSRADQVVKKGFRLLVSRKQFNPEWPYP